MKQALTQASLVLMLIASCLGGRGVASTVSDNAKGTYRTVFESSEARRARHAAEDDAKCLSVGFKAGTEGYGNCRLQITQIRATNQSASGGGMSFLCKDAISRGDSGGTFVHC
jgi:hypothetical protein